MNILKLLNQLTLEHFFFLNWKGFQSNFFLFTMMEFGEIMYLRHLSQASDCWTDWSGCCCWINPSSASDDSFASLATPDADTSTFHCIFATEAAGVLSVLGDFNLLDHLPERGTITSTVLSYNSDLLCTFCLKLNERDH